MKTEYLILIGAGMFVIVAVVICVYAWFSVNPTKKKPDFLDITEEYYHK